MLSEMEPFEWEEWQLYHERHPLGTRHTDHLFAMLAQTIANFSMTLNRDMFPNGVDLEDFLPVWGRDGNRPTQLTVEQSTQLLVELAAEMGAADLRFVQ